MPQPYLSWGTEKDFSGGAAAKAIQARFSRGHTTEWRYRGGKYVNTNSNAAAGKDFRPDTVIVVRVRQGDAGYLDPAGNRVPETIYKGTGKAVVFHGGKAVRGTWTKSGPAGALVLKTKAGNMKIPAGHTWIELLPRNGAGGRLRLPGVSPWDRRRRWRRHLTSSRSSRAVPELTRCREPVPRVTMEAWSPSTFVSTGWSCGPVGC